MERQYPSLSPELRTLESDARRLWGDPPERRCAIQAIVESLEAGDNRGRHAVQRVDNAVTAGLRALGLPRGPVRDVVIAGGIGAYGQKDPDCTVILYGDAIRTLLAGDQGPDTTFRTWVHESLHARQPFSARHDREYQTWRGFEEGLVEGLARLLLRRKAGMNPLAESFEYYVAAYRSLAMATSIDVETLWRRLWEEPLGEVRGAFVETVDHVRREAQHEALTAGQRAKLQGIADQLFHSARWNQSPDADVMMRLWRTALP